MGTRSWRALLATGALAVGIGAVAAFAGAAITLPPSGNGITPSSAQGKDWLTCEEAPTGQSHIFGLAVAKGSASAYNGTWDKSNTSHTHGNDNPLRVTISNSNDDGGVSSFDWSANMPVDYVFVKGSAGALKYDYSSYGWGGHPASGPWGDTGLVYPTGDKESISQILFCTIKKLRVEKTAVAGFAREYNWTIAKKVKTTGNDYASSADLALQDGNSGVAHWQIVADQTGSADSGFNVAGVITVLNSSPFDVAGIVDESLSNVTFGGACTAKAGTDDKANLLVRKGLTVTCTYSAPLASKTDGTNSVEVDPTDPDWMATASASRAYEFGSPASEKNKTVRWSDSNGQSKTGIDGDNTTTYDTSHSCPGSREVLNTATLYGDADANLGSSTATVRIICTPPPTPPVNPPQTKPEAPKIDIGVTKSATSTVTSGQTVTYTVTVSNVAQVAAGAVEVRDPAPTGISYPPQVATSSDAAVSCTVAPSLVTCTRPGPFAVGASFVVTIKATATGAAGTSITNVVLVSTPGDSNPANDRAQATTQLVAGPLKPPVTKPKPDVKPVVCATLTVAQKTIRVGKKGKIRIVVTAAGNPVKGASVRLFGAGIYRVVKTGKNGTTVAVVTSSKSGIVTVSISGKKGCNTARVGVVGSYEPPVTG